MFICGNCAAQCRWSQDFSGISRFSHPFILVLFHISLISPSSALKTLLFKSCPHLFTHLQHRRATEWTTFRRGSHSSLLCLLELLLQPDGALLCVHQCRLLLLPLTGQFLLSVPLQTQTFLNRRECAVVSVHPCLIKKMANHDEPENRSNIPRFNPKNYFAWRLRAKAELIQSNFWNKIEPGFTEPPNTDQKRINRKALSFLYKNVSDTYLSDIAERLRSLKSLFLISKDNEEELRKYVTCVQNQYQKVKSASWNNTDKHIAGLILLGLPWNKYGSVALVEEGNEDRDEGKIQALVLLPEKKCYKCSEWGHIAKFCDKVKCFRCGKNRHWARDCKEEVQTKISETTADRQRDGMQKYKVLVSACGLVSTKKEAVCWVVDSTATDHIANKRKLFVNFKACQGEITVGKGVAEIKGCGAGEVKVADECGGWTLTVLDILYVPDSKLNLLSVSKIVAKGVHVEMNDNASDCVEVRDGTPLKSISLWHQRLGQLNEASIKKIQDLDVEGKIHEPCIKGKMTKIGFPKMSDIRSKQPLDLIHLDLMGRLPKTIRKARYLLTFIEYYYRHLTVRFLGVKSDKFTTFKDYQREVELLHGMKIKALEMDGRALHLFPPKSSQDNETVISMSKTWEGIQMLRTCEGSKRAQPEHWYAGLTTSKNQDRNTKVVMGVMGVDHLAADNENGQTYSTSEQRFEMSPSNLAAQFTLTQHSVAYSLENT
ncbi:hypothetical protein PR048_021299 [Dryococelus australis]|uniref:CCHC-type domain-containing protein n=1 Tax=Dryococelus australis TaxID=614101 RepID=A0ABQ9GXW9_9NEOP|nr:hypothetical protein PR048_021299 [Dryococelus australis]